MGFTLCQSTFFPLYLLFVILPLLSRRGGGCHPLALVCFGQGWFGGKGSKGEELGFIHGDPLGWGGWIPQGSLCIARVFSVLWLKRGGFSWGSFCLCSSSLEFSGCELLRWGYFKRQKNHPSDITTGSHHESWDPSTVSQPSFLFFNLLLVAFTFESSVSLLSRTLTKKKKKKSQTLEKEVYSVD